MLWTNCTVAVSKQSTCLHVCTIVQTGKGYPSLLNNVHIQLCEQVKGFKSITCQTIILSHQHKPPYFSWDLLCYGTFY